MKKTTVYYILLSLFASALNYLTYPLLARLLPPGQYVDITVALSLFTQMSTFMSSIAALAVGLSKEKESGASTLSKLQTNLLQIFILLGVIFLLLSPLVMSWIKTPAAYAIPIVMMILVSIPVTVISGYLNGKNQLVKLGGVVALTASVQFLAGAITASLSHSGLMTMFVMSVIQIITIVWLVNFLKDPQLPRLSSTVFKPEALSPATRKLLLYTVIASFSIMVINILQIVDLLLIKNIDAATAKFYADMYVISRIVFFGGTIFIWPFLGELSLKNNLINKKAFLKLFGIVGAISSLAIIGMFLFGNTVTHLLFNQTYDPTLLNTIVPLSVLYKLFYLLITASCLYFIVLRNYKCVVLAVGAVAITGLSLLIAKPYDIHSLLFHLTLASALTALLAVTLLWTQKVVRPEGTS